MFIFSAASPFWPLFAASLSCTASNRAKMSNTPLVCPVSEDEVTKDADDVGFPREKYVEDLLHALTGRKGGRGGRQGEDEAVYSFSLAPDHCRLSYKKICNGMTVSKNWTTYDTFVV